MKYSGVLISSSELRKLKSSKLQLYSQAVLSYVFRAALNMFLELTDNLVPNQTLMVPFIVRTRVNYNNLELDDETREDV